MDNVNTLYLQMINQQKSQVLRSARVCSSCVCEDFLEGVNILKAINTDTPEKLFKHFGLNILNNPSESTYIQWCCITMVNISLLKSNSVSECWKAN